MNQYLYMAVIIHYETLTKDFSSAFSFHVLGAPSLSLSLVFCYYISER